MFICKVCYKTFKTLKDLEKHYNHGGYWPKIKEANKETQEIKKQAIKICN